MAGLVDQIEEVAASGTFVDSAARFTNNMGTPLVSADPSNDGSAIADVYSLTFDNVVAETSADVIVETESPNNPYNGQIFSVDLDGATEYDNIVPGVTLIFSDDAGFVVSWAGEVRVGRYAGSFASFGSGAGVPGTARRHRVKNTGAATATSCAAQVVTSVVLYPQVGQIFTFVKPFAENAVEKLDSDQTVGYAVTVENKTGVGAVITADIKIDGALIDVKNLTTEAETTSEDLNVVDEYEVVDGDLEGVRFKLSQAILNTATANLLVFENLHTQIAPDVSGAAGTFATTDVELTEVGEGAGEITAGGFAFYWERTLVAEGSSSARNPAIGNVRLTGDVGTEAGWIS